MSKKALGKGIAALISTTKTDSDLQSTLMIDIELIKPNPAQPRKIFSEDSLKELAASIKEKGIIQPLLVERNPDQTYTLIAGERRFRAAKIAGLKSVPVVVRRFSEVEKIEIALIENIQREDLTPIEEAMAYENLLKLSGISQEELASHLGKNRSTIANSLRLLKLPEEIKKALNDRIISAGHARAILALSSQTNQLELFKEIVAKNLSVREAENIASKMAAKKALKNNSSEKAPFLHEPELVDLKQKLINVLGTKVEIKGNLLEGKIEIFYFSADDLERIYEIIIKE